MKHPSLPRIFRAAMLFAATGGASLSQSPALPNAVPVPPAGSRTPQPANPPRPVPEAGGVLPAAGPSEPGAPPPRPALPPGLQIPAPQVVLTQGDYSYTTNDRGEATIVGFNKDFRGGLNLLDTLGGCPVSGIASQAFTPHSGITRLRIPASIVNPGMSFAGCANLAAIEVDPANPSYSSVDGVLFNKEKTTLIHYPPGKSGAYSIPEGVVEVGDGCFLGCAALTGITIPASVSRIGWSAFHQCGSLAAIHVADENSIYSSLDGVLFNKDQTALLLTPAAREGVWAMPAKVARMDRHALSACVALTRISIPDGLTQLHSTDFLDCRSLAAFEVSPANPNYSSPDGVLFDKNRTRLVRCPPMKDGEYAIPPGVTAIDSHAFRNCLKLTHVTIPGSVTVIASQAFQGCESLSVTIQGIGRLDLYAGSRVIPLPNSGLLSPPMAPAAPAPPDPAASTSPGGPPRLPLPGRRFPSGRTRFVPTESRSLQGPALPGPGFP